ncbi:hypothetical protein BT96DRAFT_1016330 [Gymnopus androsaceus JB14]|uniref:Uncharacterized protein n=1 Tax=Gymnopus androsaceus JB14 TaxID=1447944 RepID=A0A6A4I1A2_9AGAR|nr:hypothetical protein BT96DRAFT_1016330 [Gymnopus androsaceus JB14]
MVAIENPIVSDTTSLSSKSSSSLPLVTSHLKNPLHSFNVHPTIILSAAGIGILIALGLFVFICWKTRKSIIDFGLGRAQFVTTKEDICDKRYNKLKPLKLQLRPKTQPFSFTKPTVNANKRFSTRLPDSQEKAHLLPDEPPSSLYLYRFHHSRQRDPSPLSSSTTRNPDSAMFTRISSVAPVLPPLPMPAFALNAIPALCSPPSTSPKEIFEWIQSDSVLSSQDGYARAREDSRLVCIFPETRKPSQTSITGTKMKTTYALAQEARMSMSMLSSSTLNKIGARGPFMSLSSRSPLSQLCTNADSSASRSNSQLSSEHSSASPISASYLSKDLSPSKTHRQYYPFGHSSQNHTGATRIPSISHLEECHLGPLEQGTRWGSMWHTLEKPIPNRIPSQGYKGHRRAAKEGKENR